MRGAGDESGLVLTELLVAMVMAIVIFGAAVDAFVTFLNGDTHNRAQTQAQDTARTAIDRLASVLRNGMASGTAGSQPVEQYSSSSLVVLIPDPTASLTNNPRGLVHRRYCLNLTDPANELLYRQTAPYDTATNATPPSTAACPDAGWPAANTVVVVSNLVNQLQSPAKPFFTYTTATASSGTYVTDVAMDAVVDTDPTKPPPSTELQSTVTLRNVNHAPNAVLSPCQALNGHAICNASGSSDPDGQTLYYQWYMDGTLLGGQTGYQLDQASLASGSNHTFQVTVTDSGGLSNSATSTLTMP